MKTLVFASIVILTVQVHAQSSLTGLYDFGLREPALVATTPIGKLTNVLGKGFNLDVDLFAGSTLRTKSTLTGTLIGKRFPLANEASGYIGAGLTFTPKWNFAVGAGVSWRF